MSAYANLEAGAEDAEEDISESCMRMIWLCVSSHWPLRLFGLKGLLARASAAVPAEADGVPVEVDPCDGVVGAVGLGAGINREVAVLLAILLSAPGSSEGMILAGASLILCSLARKACVSSSLGSVGTIAAGVFVIYCRFTGALPSF